MPTNGQTGLVIPVPAADPLLTLVETRHPGTVREGVPAHVSLLYPFVGAAELDERVTRALSELVAGHEPMPVEFVECYRSGGFVALRPDPIEGLTELTRKTRDRWPDMVPYEGVYGDVEPHVTVAMRASEETAMTIEQEVTEQLPISAELREVWLVAFDGRWTLQGRFEFGAGH
ncbi:MAG: 2'-5' RNA ligase family protein [Pseudonocardiaceae bacterium]